MDPVLSIRGLGVQYGALVALDGVSWDVSAGEVLGIIGPNGAGKSTCLAATTNSTRHVGTVHFRGQDVTRVPTFELAARGLRRTYQQNSFFEDQTVLENAECCLHRRYSTPLVQATLMPWRERSARAKARREARHLLTSMGIAEKYFDELPATIPYGVQRLLSIALSFSGDATALLLDEPAAGVGGEDMVELANLLRLLRDRGTAMVLIEHHMDLIMSIADRIVVLDQGRVLATGKPDEVRRDPVVLKAYLGEDAA